ncbi:thioredoxin-disulfide reductase [Pseudoramibacter alactolyticus ATCC 23263]|uniref:Thioredoxin reductase n=1 Tax=Pseudoramibacter alactolyticus ATCC 23263 TaxID=887929 RepID=E6MEP7_9FIRM|nr:thioredoxin-disulfide reductase [Pseudoramibacter alactolyticus]EFV02572.1 thioredoxin-disulfide reductase [Pseudoramibacter alactolyticus ATCC 23263]
MKDLIIIGSGPAGLTAGIYAERAKMDTIVIERNYMSGGQIIDTYEVDNYPGLPGINGFDLAQKMREHADKLGVNFVNAEVKRVEDLGDVKRIYTDKEVYEAKAVLFTSGAGHSKLGIPGEDTYGGKGVSYCATCDGAFYRGKDVAVIGGGNVAVEDAIFLARGSRKVYVVHRRDELRAIKSLQEQLFAMDNIEMVWDSVATEIVGNDGKTSGVRVHNKKTGTDKVLPVDGVFVAVGIVPNTELFKGICAMDDRGYIIAGEDGKTNTPGFFVAGDARTKQVRQVATAVGDGASVVSSIDRYLTTGEW